eukprot:1697126-Rhodomonas_salina.1
MSAVTCVQSIRDSKSAPCQTFCPRPQCYARTQRGGRVGRTQRIQCIESGECADERREGQEDQHPSPEGLHSPGRFP